MQAIPLLSWQLPVALQAWHWPQALLVQQNPSVQLPLLHWSFIVQVAPRSNLLMHEPMGRSWQKLPLEQSPSPAQVVRQPVEPLHMYGAQLWVVDVSHKPDAHWPGFVSVEELLGHDAGAQVVPFGYFWQPPAPSHLPFVPQLALLQQTLSTQWLALAPHWPSRVQALPGVTLRTQLPPVPVQ